MAIPVTLETLVGVVLPLEPQEVDELRVAGLDLAACGPAVIRQVVAAARAERKVDEPAKRVGRSRDPLGSVHDVQIEDHAGPGLPGPGQEALVVALDEADRSVDDRGPMLAEACPDVVDEARQGGARNVDLGDYLGRGRGGAELPVQALVVVVDVETELVRVRPVALTGRRTRTS